MMYVREDQKMFKIKDGERYEELLQVTCDKVGINLGTTPGDGAFKDMIIKDDNSLNGLQ